MRHEENYFDLNNLPDDFSIDRDKQALKEGSSSGQRKKKGSKEGKDESGKVYECRFCSLKFFKSQALGGHMNRHRQERETETLNQARQLVYGNDTLTPHGVSTFGYHATEPTIYRSVYSSPMLYPRSPFTNLIPQPYPYSSNQYSPQNHFNYYLNPTFQESRSNSPNPCHPTTTTSVNYMTDGSMEPSYISSGAPVGPTDISRRGARNLCDGDVSRQRLDHSHRLPISQFQDHYSL